MSRYDSVSDVYFNGRNSTSTIINVEFNSGEIVHGFLSASPYRALRTIKNDINSMFNLEIDSYGSLWEIEGTVIH